MDKLNITILWSIMWIIVTIRIYSSRLYDKLFPMVSDDDNQRHQDFMHYQHHGPMEVKQQCLRYPHFDNSRSLKCETLNLYDSTPTLTSSTCPSCITSTTAAQGSNARSIPGNNTASRRTRPRFRRHLIREKLFGNNNKRRLLF